MKSSLKKVKDCRVKLFVEVEPELVEGRYQEVLKSFQRIARIPGFREGKAPADMIEKKYSREAEEELLKTLIPEAYHQSIATQKVSAVTLPSISEIQYQRGKKLTFMAEFEQQPEISIKNYKGIKLKREGSEVGEKDVEEAMQSLIESRATLVPLTTPRPVQKHDFVVADVELWKDGAYVPGRKGTLLFVDPNPEDDFYDKVLGANLEEVCEVSRKGEPYTKIWIKAIKEKQLPVLDEEFAKSFGKETVAELSEAVRKDVSSHRQSESFEKMKAELFQKLLAMVSVALPEGLVAKQKERMVDQAIRQYRSMGMPEDKLEEAKAKAEPEAASRAHDQVKLYFILQKIADLEQIELDEMEFEEKLQGIVEESSRPIEEVRATFEEDLRASLLEKKTIDFLIANAKFEEEKKS